MQSEIVTQCIQQRHFRVVRNDRRRLAVHIEREFHRGPLPPYPVILFPCKRLGNRRSRQYGWKPSQKRSEQPLAREVPERAPRQYRRRTARGERGNDKAIGARSSF